MTEERTDVIRIFAHQLVELKIDASAPGALEAVEDYDHHLGVGRTPRGAAARNSDPVNRVVDDAFDVDRR
jgi:hypothetical protein